MGALQYAGTLVLAAALAGVVAAYVVPYLDALSAVTKAVTP